MSKIGKKPIIVPAGVTVTVANGEVKVKGAKGELHYSLPTGVEVVVSGTSVSVKRKGNDPQERRLHGLVRAFVQNMVIGASKGFEKRLEMIGVGYRAQATGKKITLNLGFSHPVDYHAPEGVSIQMDQENKNLIIISGANRQKVGQVASDLRALRPPEPYKGKGIRYVDEHVVRKAGKAAATAGGTSA